MSTEGSSLRESIEHYLLKERMSRAQLAAKLGYSRGQIDKLMSGQAVPSEKFLKALRVRAGIKISEQSKDGIPMPSLVWSDVIHLEGRWQTVRPSFREESAISCFVTDVSWDEGAKSLTFRELGNSNSPENSGIVSVPRQSTNVFFLTHGDGTFRLAIMATAYSKMQLYGGLLTVGSATMASRNPTACPLVMQKLSPNAHEVTGLIQVDHPKYEEWSKNLALAKTEGFFKAL